MTEEDRTEPLPELTAEPDEADESEASVEEREPAAGTDKPASDEAAAEDSPFAPLLAEASAEAGQKVFRKCQACHRLEEGQNAIGPHLYGVVGREIAGVEGYSYSDALANKEGVWDLANLDGFLADPKGWASGTKMSFAGLRDPQDRVDVITYLNEVSESPVDLGATEDGTRQAAAGRDTVGAEAESAPAAGAPQAGDGAGTAESASGQDKTDRAAAAPAGDAAEQTRSAGATETASARSSAEAEPAIAPADEAGIAAESSEAASDPRAKVAFTQTASAADALTEALAQAAELLARGQPLAAPAD